MADMSSIAGRQINIYNNLSPTFRTQIMPNVTEMAKVTDNGNDSSVNNDNGQSFVQSVIQTLQNLGLPAPESSDESLQTFVQNLYNALTQNSDTVPAPDDTNNGIDNLPVPIPENTDEINTKISGGTNLQYIVDFSGADLGEYLSDVKANIATALENIGQFIGSKAIFNLRVLTINEETDVLAQASASVISTTDNPDNVNADTTFIADSIRGMDLNFNTNDSTLHINLAKMDQMSFTGEPTPDKYDLTTILTHEILHGLAFTGLIDNKNKTIKTAYDGLITTKNGVPFFVGRHAKTANGGNPVPLTPADFGSGSAYYHVAIPEDLMAPSVRKGEVKFISNLDVAMLQDMGISITGTSAPNTNSDINAKLQTAYNNSNNLLNLTEDLNNNSELKANFSNLTPSSNDSSSTVNLQDFLLQFAFDNGNPIQNSTGSLFSAKA